MAILKKIGVTLVVLILVLAVAAWWVLRGETADFSVEQVAGVSIRYRRCTPLLLGMLEAVGVAVGGRDAAGRNPSGPARQGWHNRLRKAESR